jgi:hypothetical protein
MACPYVSDGGRSLPDLTRAWNQVVGAVRPFDFAHGSILLTVPEQGRGEGREVSTLLSLPERSRRERKSTGEPPLLSRVASAGSIVYRQSTMG